MGLKMIQPLLTVVIPTCDRPYLLEHTARAYALNKDSRIEVLVSDNFSDPKTKEAIQELIDQGLVKYVRTSKRLDMCAHWNFAFSHVQGRYVMFSGDDDVVIVPEFMSGVLDLIQNKQPEMFTWKLSQYWHPDWYKKWEAGNLQIGRNVTGYLYKANAVAAMRRYANIQLDCFPQAFSLIFLRDLGERVKQKHGRLFWPYAPDFTASCLMLTELDSEGWIFLDYNLGYGGRSFHSNAASLEKNADKKLSNRARAFEAEFENADLFPYHDLKISSVHNMFFAPFFLAKHLCPEFFSKHPCVFNYEEFALKILHDIYQVKLNQPFIRPGDENRLREWMSKHAPEAWKRAEQRFKRQRARVKRRAHRAKHPQLDTPSDHKLEEADQPHLDGLYTLDAENASIRCPLLNIHNSFELSKVAHHFFNRFAVCSWSHVRSPIESGVLYPISPYVDPKLPHLNLDLITGEHIVSDPLPSPKKSKLSTMFRAFKQTIGI